MELLPGDDGLKHRVKSTGFTLVEMLVVLAIIAILAGLLVPVIRAERHKALQTVCIDNMHQLGLALSMYSQDYDGGYPGYMVDKLDRAHSSDQLYWHSHFCRGTHDSVGQLNWALLTRPYVTRELPKGHGRNSVFFCPSDTDRSARPYTSFELKMYLAAGGRTSGIQDAAGMAMIWEQWDFHSPIHYSEFDLRATLDTVFVDGHAKALRLSDTTSARYDNGPNLHWRFKSRGSASSGSNGSDVIQ